MDRIMIALIFYGLANKDRIFSCNHEEVEKYYAQFLVSCKHYFPPDLL